jgi:hypothetical protein
MLFAVSVQAQPPPALPSPVRVVWTQPGSAPQSYTVSLEHGAAGWTLVGCGVTGTAQPSGCRRTRSATLSSAQVTALQDAWRDAHNHVRCEPEARGPGAGDFRVGTTSEAVEGFLPADAASNGPSMAGPCHAWARFVWLLAADFRATP